VLRVARTGGALPDPVRQPGRDEQYADVSPDGRQVAFVRTEHGASHIYIAPLDGNGAATRLSPAIATLPRWAPDGRSIAFTRTRGSDSGIFVVGADGSGQRQLTATGGWPVWFPDGRRLGYVVVGADETQQVWVQPLDGSPPSLLDAVRLSGTNNPIDISPDGRLLATTDSYVVSSELWLLRPDRPRNTSAQ
jgi:Tol biopolymer transport system component